MIFIWRQMLCFHNTSKCWSEYMPLPPRIIMLIIVTIPLWKGLNFVFLFLSIWHQIMVYYVQILFMFKVVIQRFQNYQHLGSYTKVLIIILNVELKPWTWTKFEHFNLFPLSCIQIPLTNKKLKGDSCYRNDKRLLSRL